MTTMTEINLVTQVYQVFIKAPPQQIWDAITKPEFTAKYFHGSLVDSTFEVGAEYRSYSPDRWQLCEGGVSKLTVVHDELGASPKTAASVYGEGWMYVLSGLKTLLETGEPLQS